MPEWLKLIDNGNGKIARIEKEMPIFMILKKLKAL